MTNILVTGCNGFIASHLIDFLSNNSDNRIVGITRSIRKESTFNALKLAEKNNVGVIFGNVNNYSDIEETIAKYDIDNIYHLAAKVIVKDASKAPISTIDINVNGTLNILEAVRVMPQQMGKDISTLVMSSDKAYSLDNSLPYLENQPIDGSDIYSSSKAMQDILARSYAYNYDLPIVVARPVNTYGEYDFNWSRIIPSIAKSCFGEEEKLVLNKGSFHQIREYLYVKDTVRALITLMDHIYDTKGQAFNISSNDKFTTEEIVLRFLRYANKFKEIEFREKAKSFKEIPSQYLDTTKIQNICGWKPKYNIESGLKETIKGYKNWFDKE
jgi:nucleoside-diphosphate-sugar epimerase